MENDNLSIGKLFDSDIGQELVQGKATSIADKVVIRNGTVLYFDKSLLDSGEAPPSDYFSPPTLPCSAKPARLSRGGLTWI